MPIFMARPRSEPGLEALERGHDVVELRRPLRPEAFGELDADQETEVARARIHGIEEALLRKNGHRLRRCLAVKLAREGPDGGSPGLHGRRDVDYEVRLVEVTGRKVDRLLRPMGRMTRLDLPQPGVEREVSDEPSRARVVGMTVLRIGGEDQPRPLPPDQVDDRKLLFASAGDPAVAEVERLPELGTEDLRRPFRFLAADRVGPPRAELPARQVHDAELSALRLQAGERAPARQLDVV